MRRLLVVVTTISLLLVGVGGAAASAGGSVGGFDDVHSGDYFAKPVQWMANERITTGTAACTFSPSAGLTRGQGATFVWRLEGARKAKADHGFGDVTAAWQQEPISWLASKGYITGITPTRFAPDALMTRAQFAVLLWRVAGEPSVKASMPFDDVTAAWQIDAVKWMAKRGITTGTSPSTFSPDAPLTRGQAATFLYRLEGSPRVSLDTSPCGGSDEPTLPTSGAVEAPRGTLGPRTTVAIDPATVPGMTRTNGLWQMNRDWDEIKEGGYLDFGPGALDVNGRKVEGFTIEVGPGLEGKHVIDGGGIVGYFEISNPARRSHNSYIRVIDEAYNYIATGVVGDAIKVPEGFSYHRDALIVMDVVPGGANDKHYDGAQIFGSGSARLERIVIDWNDAGTVANTTGAIFTQDGASLTARDILIVDPGGTWQPVRLSGSGPHDVARIQVIGTREPNNTSGKLAPTALVKITNGSGTFNLINDVPGTDDWLFE